MKTLLVLSIFFAYAWATSEPKNIQRLTAAAIHRCKEKSLGDVHIMEQFKNGILPEGNAKFSEFFACYWQELGILKKDKTFAHTLLEDFTRNGLQEKFPNVADPFKAAKDAIEQCKDSLQADSVGLNAIQYKNCITKYVKNLQE